MKVKITKSPPKEMFNYVFKVGKQAHVSTYLGNKLVDNGFAEMVDHTMADIIEINDEEE